jgi:hypothetical protein
LGRGISKYGAFEVEVSFGGIVREDWRDEGPDVFAQSEEASNVGIMWNDSTLAGIYAEST